MRARAAAPALCTPLSQPLQPWWLLLLLWGAAGCVQIMKSDEDVRMISAEAPVLFAKVCACALCNTASHGCIQIPRQRRRPDSLPLHHAAGATAWLACTSACMHCCHPPPRCLLTGM